MSSQHSSETEADQNSGLVAFIGFFVFVVFIGALWNMSSVKGANKKNYIIVGVIGTLIILGAFGGGIIALQLNK
jgi:hypothetical protein